MSREIKFRAFSKIKKRMFPVYGLGHDWVTEDTLDGVDPGNNCFSGSDFLNDIVVMQFTGLKDKNGTDIFEGELILWDTDLRFIVVFNNGRFYGKPHPDNHIPCTLHFHHFSKSEIIGNIHQNPELL